MTSAPHSITIVIPAYNEGAVIAQTATAVLTFLKESSFPYACTLCIVDNASTDNTWSEIELLMRKHPEVTGLHLTEKGKGRAIRAGWARSDCGILSFMDADLSSDLASFKPLIDAVASGSVDLSIGNRLGVRSKIVSTKDFRKFASLVYNFMARAFLGTRVDDHQCGFKAVSREAYTTLAPDLTENGFFLDTELLALARKRGFSIHQEDIIWIDSPTSKVSLISDSLKMFVSVLRLSWRLGL
jgi:glycosyltransferase involved in cell wall biosynthesis